MKVLTKAEIMSETKLVTEDVPFGNGKLIVTQISAEDLQLMRKEVEDAAGNPDMEKFNYVLLAYTLVNENGDRIFNDGEITVFKKSAPGKFNAALKVAMKLNGLLGDEGNDSEATISASSTGELQLDLDTDTQTNSTEV